jgi:hypothetical protein
MEIFKERKLGGLGSSHLRLDNLVLGGELGEEN